MNTAGRVLSLLTAVPMLLALVTATAVGEEPPASQNNRCTICHLGWIDVPGKELDSLTRGGKDLSRLRDRLDVTVKEEVCYGCHDGFMMDSRERAWKGKPHSAGKTPSSKVHVPNTFPLNPEGKVYCGTCHSPHTGDRLSVEFSGRKFLRVENIDSMLCKNCHLSYLNEPGRKNHSVDVLAERPIPAWIEEKGGRLGSDPKKVICQSCHAPHGVTTLVAPLEDSALCLACHEDKASGGGIVKAGNPAHPVNVTPSRALWEGGEMPGNARVGSKGSLLCSTCHTTHDGRAEPLLVVADDRDFCTRCHRKEAEALAGTKHDLMLTAPTFRNRKGKSPGESGPCGGCHMAHGWAQEVSPGSDPVSAICLACHREKGSAEKEQVGTFSHPVGVPSKSGSMDAAGEKDLPWWVHKGEAKVVCASCHDVHRYAPDPDAPDLPLDQDGDGSNSFLRKTGERLCLDCHGDQETVLVSPHNMTTFEGPLEDGYKETLRRGGPCNGCHRTHNAMAEKLWFKGLAAPAGSFDSDEGVRRCLSCHGDEAMKRVAEGRGHPLGREIKLEYMPGEDRALKLGRREVDGRSVPVAICDTCHLVHGEKGADGKTRLFAGGGGETSQLCVACHSEAGGVLGSPHDFRTRDSGAMYRPDEGRVDAYGVCAGCHANHNAKHAEKLFWFEVPEPSGKGNPEDMLCLYCHGNPELKHDERIRFYAHPMYADVKEVLANRIRKGDLPVALRIEEEGRGLTPILDYQSMSLVRCTTCHDNHRWVPDETEGQVQEGDSSGESGNFLRGSLVAQRICSVCHGQQALYRYKFFHEERAFTKKIPNE